MISDKPLVSIAIPAYNCSRFIAPCLNSISTQTYKNYEVVIVDDCSTDHSLNMIERAVNFYRLQKKTKLFSHSINYGCGMTEKHAIEFGSGELVVIIDSDDALSLDEALELLVIAHQENPDASLVYSDFWSCDEKLTPKNVRKGTSNFVSHVKCFKRSFYDKTEGVDPTLLKSVDKDLILKLEEVGELIHIPIPLYYRRVHKNSISSLFKHRSKEQQQKMNAARIDIYRKAAERRKKKHENIS